MFGKNIHYHVISFKLYQTIHTLYVLFNNNILYSGHRLTFFLLECFINQIMLCCNFVINISLLGKCIPKLLRYLLFLVHYVCINIYILCYNMIYVLDSNLQVYILVICDMFYFIMWID